MDSARWQELSRLLDTALELDIAARAQYLISLRADDAPLADELEKLLALEQDAESFLSEPLVAPLPGARAEALVGPYRLERMLGEGGMGQVWLARREDGLYTRRVALKLLRPGLADPNLRLRFTRERQILSRLEHPHIASLLDAGVSSDNQPYLALEYVEGEPLTDWCRTRSLDLEKRLRLFLQVCAAVSHAHANLIVHRDLKPSNILVTSLDEVRLLDFGIAKLLDSAEPMPEHTRTGLRAFTLHYAAPEQIRGEPVTTMTDVYSLGVVLYELLTDMKPYRLKRQSDAEWEEAILHADPLRPSAALQRNDETQIDDANDRRRRARALVGDLDNIVLKTLSKRPEQRYSSVEALTLDVHRYLAGKPVQARPQSVPYRVRKYVFRHRWVLATVLLIGSVLSTALGIVAWQAQEAVQETRRAQALQNFIFGLFENAGSASRGAPLDVRQLLSDGVARGNRVLANEPVARAELFGVIARLRLEIGDYPQALALLKQQADIVATNEVSPSLKLESTTDLGRAQRMMNQSRACIETMRGAQALAAREQQQLPVQAAEFFSQLGRCHRKVGERALARSLIQRSLALRRNPLNDNAGVVENLADLAGLQSDAGNTAAALRAFQAALAQLRATSGERHPLAIELQRNIAALHVQGNDLPAAINAYRDALQLSDEWLGLLHPDNIALHRQLATLYARQGLYDEAAEELDAASQGLQRRADYSPQQLANHLTMRGRISWERNRIEEARALFEQAVALQRRSDQPLTLADTLAQFAGVLQESKRPEQALRALDEARRLRVAKLGANHALVASTDVQIGELSSAMGRISQARARLEQVANRFRQKQPVTATDVLRAQLALARLASADTNNLDNAMTPFERIIARSGDNDRTLRWKARAYAAELLCRNNESELARTEFDDLLQEVATAFPQGGVFSRELSRLSAACEVAPVDHAQTTT